MSTIIPSWYIPWYVYSWYVCIISLLLVSDIAENAEPNRRYQVNRQVAEHHMDGALSALQRYGWMRRKWVDMSCAATGNTGWSTWWIEAACVTWSGAGAKREVHRAGTRRPAIGSLEALEAAERNGAKAKAVAREALVAR